MQTHADPCRPMQAHADPCRPMQTHAGPCRPMQAHAVPCSPLQSHTGPCRPMQTHAGSCRPMQTHGSMNTYCQMPFLPSESTTLLAGSATWPVPRHGRFRDMAGSVTWPTFRTRLLIAVHNLCRYTGCFVFGHICSLMNSVRLFEYCLSLPTMEAAGITCVPRERWISAGFMIMTSGIIYGQTV